MNVRAILECLSTASSTIITGATLSDCVVKSLDTLSYSASHIVDGVKEVKRLVNRDFIHAGHSMNKTSVRQKITELDEREVKEICKNYETKRESKFFKSSPSKETQKTMEDALMIKDDGVRANIILSYLFKENNKGRDFYEVCSEYITNKIFYD